MSCPYLKYVSKSFIGWLDDYYLCTVTQVQMPLDDTKAKHLCDTDCEYENCPIYQDYRR